MATVHQGGKFKGTLSGSFSDLFSGFQRMFKGMGSFRVDVNLDPNRSWVWSERQWDAALEPAEAVAFRKSGVILRSEIRKLLRIRKSRYSEPDSPPKVTGKESHLRHGIRWHYDEARQELVVGPRYIPWLNKKVYTFPQPTIPSTLEFGGRVRVGYPSVHIESGADLPANRVVRIAPRPYVSRALKQKRERLLDLWSDLLGTTPPSMSIKGERIT